MRQTRCARLPKFVVPATVKFTEEGTAWITPKQIPKPGGSAVVGGQDEHNTVS